MNNDNLELAKITTDEQWQAYRKLFQEEFKRRDIKAEPLPEQRPEPTAEVKLNQTINKAIELWKRDSQSIKGIFGNIHQQFQQDSQYHYYQARTYLENTLSGAMGIVGDTLGLPHQQSVDYIIDLDDCLGNSFAEETKQSPKQIKSETQQSSNLIDKIVTKSTEDIAIVENAVCGFLDMFRGR